MHVGFLNTTIVVRISMKKRLSILHLADKVKLSCFSFHD